MIFEIFIIFMLLYFCFVHQFIYQYFLSHSLWKMWHFSLFWKIKEISLDELPSNIIDALKLEFTKTKNKLSFLLKFTIIYCPIHVFIFISLGIIVGVLLSLNKMPIGDFSLLDYNFYLSRSNFWGIYLAGSIHIVLNISIGLSRILILKKRNMLINEKINKVKYSDNFKVDENKFVNLNEKNHNFKIFAYRVNSPKKWINYFYKLDFDNIEKQYSKNEALRIYETILWLAENTKENKKYEFFNIKLLLDRYNELNNKNE